MKKSICLIIALLLLTIPLIAQNDQASTEFKPVEYSDKFNKLSRKDFFEKYHRSTWDSLSEIEQFAIACSSNIFQRNGQYHLDFSNRIVFDEDTRKGIEVLNENWEIFNYEQLIQNYNELIEGEQATSYKELEEILNRNPGLSVIDIGIKEGMSVSSVSRMYLVQAMKDKLGKHGIEAWTQARSISIIRWGIGAGYISQEEGYSLIEPVVKEIIDNYTCFDEFIAHWVAGYCFNAVYDSTCPECTEILIEAIDEARAYIPFEELKFTGVNADTSYCMKVLDAVYNPDEFASKMIPVQKVYKRYQKEQPSAELYEELLKVEQDYPEISDLLILCRYSMMLKFCDSKERIEYAESKLDYLKNNPNTQGLYSDIVRIYSSDLLRTYQPEKVIALYKTLPVQYQSDELVYYNYGYANFLMINICQTILEKNVYQSRAIDVFRRLYSRGYDIGDMVNWLRVVE